MELTMPWLHNIKTMIVNLMMYCSKILAFIDSYTDMDTSVHIIQIWMRIRIQMQIHKHVVPAWSFHFDLSLINPDCQLKMEIKIRQKVSKTVNEMGPWAEM